MEFSGECCYDFALLIIMTQIEMSTFSTWYLHNLLDGFQEIDPLLSPPKLTTVVTEVSDT